CKNINLINNPIHLYLANINDRWSTLMESSKNYQVLLYYNYAHIEDPETFAEENLQFCIDLELKGRIVVANEGINGTVSGTDENPTKYMESMHNDPRFSNMTFKVDTHDGYAFIKMYLHPRSQSVTLSLEDDVNPKQTTGQYLETKEFYEAMQDENTVVLDARNDYEFDLGHFRGAIRPDIETFRELPEWVRENRHLIEGKR